MAKVEFSFSQKLAERARGTSGMTVQVYKRRSRREGGQRVPPSLVYSSLSPPTRDHLPLRVSVIGDFT